MNKILFMTTMADDSWGGSEELWCEMAKTAIKSGYDVSVSFYKWDVVPTKIVDAGHIGVKLFPRNRISYSELWKKPFGKIIEKFCSKNELKKIIEKSKPEHVVISMGGFCDLEIKLYQDFLNSLLIPFSLIVHVNPEDRYFKLETVREINKICEKAKKVFFVSKRLLEIAQRQTGYDFPNGEIIINPVNLSNTDLVDFPEQESTLNMACVGRLNAKVKGQALLLQVLSSPKWKDRNWKLNIYGNGPDKEYLQHLISSWNLNDKIKFHGHVQNVRDDIWSKNHILIMPSYFEGLPLALVEAMLCARTAVVTDVGGASEVLPEDVGYIAEGVTKKSLSHVLELMWSEKQYLKEKGLKGKDSINKYISSFPSYFDILKQLYE